MKFIIVKRFIVKQHRKAVQEGPSFRRGAFAQPSRRSRFQKKFTLAGNPLSDSKSYLLSSWYLPLLELGTSVKAR